MPGNIFHVDSGTRRMFSRTALYFSATEGSAVDDMDAKGVTVEMQYVYKSAARSIV